MLPRFVHKSRTQRLSCFDLNLLVTFDAVFHYRNVTKAANHLGRSQSAVSHALQRLRWLLNDDLFVKTPHGIGPTARAEIFASRVREALNQVRLSLEPQHFCPREEEKHFSIAMNNYGAVVL